MLTFPIYLFTNKISKKNRIFLGGYPPYGPLKNKASQKWRPMNAHNPYFSLQNPILLSKWGCLQKTRPQYLKNWLSYSHIKFEKNFLNFFQNFEKTWKSSSHCSLSKAQIADLHRMPQPKQQQLQPPHAFEPQPTRNGFLDGDWKQPIKNNINHLNRPMNGLSIR